MVEILHYETANRNKIIGYVDIRVPVNSPTVLLFRRIAHVQSGDRKWFNLPTFSRDKADGAPNYLRYAEFETQPHNGQLLECLSEKVKAFCAAHGIEELQPMNFDEFPPQSMDELPF